jgi:hypothetical protein
LSDRNVRAGHVRIAKGFLTMDLSRAVVVQRSLLEDMKAAAIVEPLQTLFAARLLQAIVTK